MKKTLHPGILWLLGMVSVCAAWACVIWVALQVSTIVLKTLDQIVQLAQMS